MRRNPPDISKGILRNSISRFESWHPSGPVSPFLPISDLSENARQYRGLARRHPVSSEIKLAVVGCHRDIAPPVSSRYFSISKFCWLRLGSKAMGPVVPSD